PSASIRKSTPSYPVASPSIPPEVDAKRYSESWSSKLAYREIETFESDAVVAASNMGTEDQSAKEPSITMGAEGPEGGTNRNPAIRTATRIAEAIVKYRTRRDGKGSRRPRKVGRPTDAPVI